MALRFSEIARISKYFLTMIWFWYPWFILSGRGFFSGKCIENKYRLNTEKVDFYSIFGSQMCTCLGQNCIKNLVDPDTVNSNFRSDFKSRLSYFSYKIRVKSNSSIGKKILNAKHFKLQLNCSYWSILIYTWIWNRCLSDRLNMVRDLILEMFKNVLGMDHLLL